MSIFSKINPFRMSENSEGEVPAEESSSEEAPTVEPPADESSSEETPVEEAPIEEVPAEETPTEETPAEVPPKKDLFLSMLQFLKTNKFVHEIFMIFCIVALFFMAVLSYGEVTKQEGIPSFETFHAEHTGKKIATLFTVGDMETLLSYLYMDTPSVGRQEESEKALRTQTAKQLKKEYEKLFSGLDLSVSKADTIYQTTTYGDTHLVTTCHITMSENAELLLTLEQWKKNQYTMSIRTDDMKDEKSFHKINALFSYASSAYASEKDAEITYALISGDKKALSSISDYFYQNANKENHEKYRKTLADNLQKLQSLNITVTEAFMEPYTYEKTNNQKTSSLTLRCMDKETGKTFVYYQPLIVGLYGYEANGSCSIYGSDLRPEVYNTFSLLFVEA